jgi:hypothetical protein
MKLYTAVIHCLQMCMKEYGSCQKFGRLHKTQLHIKLELWVTSLSDTPRLQYYDVQTLEYRYISKLPMKKERIWSNVKSLLELMWCVIDISTLNKTYLIWYLSLFPRFAPNTHIYLYSSTVHMYCIYPTILNRK